MGNSYIILNRNYREQRKKRGKAQNGRLRGNTDLGNCVRNRKIG